MLISFAIGSDRPRLKLLGTLLPRGLQTQAGDVDRVGLGGVRRIEDGLDAWGDVHHVVELVTVKGFENRLLIDGWIAGVSPCHTDGSKVVFAAEG